jgi:hypothetical protein
MLRVSSTQRRFNTTEAPTNPKVAEIVDQISQLTLLETADLVSSLKVRTPLALALFNAMKVPLLTQAYRASSTSLICRWEASLPPLLPLLLPPP